MLNLRIQAPSALLTFLTNGDEVSEVRLKKKEERSVNILKGFPFQATSGHLLVEDKYPSEHYFPSAIANCPIFCTLKVAA